MSNVTIAALAKLLNAEFFGDPALLVLEICHPSQAGREGAMAIATEAKFIALLKPNGAKMAILPTGTDPAEQGLDAAIFVGRPRHALSLITSHFANKIHLQPGTDATASIDPSAKIGANAAIGPFVVIGPDVVIGDNAQIMSHCSIGAASRIGDDALMHSGVRIGHDVTIGDRFIVHANAVIGADGFSFVTPEKGAVEEAKAGSGSVVTTKNTAFARIHSLGGVVIGDDVEIGAATTIDRGTLQSTSIGSGTKIDNQVQVGHNVSIGRGCLLCAQVGVAGSAQIGDRVVLGGKAGVADHVTISSDVLVAAASAVASDVPSGNIMMGVPAQKRDEAVAALMNIRRLPRLFSVVDRLKKAADQPKDG